MTTPVYDPTRPDCASCGEAWEDHLGRPFFHCPEQESNYMPLPSPAPVDAAPPKDPMTEIDARRLEYATACERMGMAHANGTRAEWESAASDEVATRTALLSSVRALAARVEEAEQEAERQRNLWESIRDARVAAAESSLERMRERVAGLADGWERASAKAKSLSDAAFNRACEGNLSSNVSCAIHEARASTLADCASALRSLESAPSTPETKDDHR